jgi:hypothetical protein
MNPVRAVRPKQPTQETRDAGAKAGGCCSRYCLGIAGYASADQPGSDWMSKEQVTEKMTAAGYSNITGLDPMTATGKVRRTERSWNSMSIRTRAR